MGVCLYIFIKSAVAKPGGTVRVPDLSWPFSWLLTNPVKSTCCVELMCYMEAWNSASVNELFSHLNNKNKTLCLSNEISIFSFFFSLSVCAA